jgi:hypothetical protein
MKSSWRKPACVHSAHSGQAAADKAFGGDDFKLDFCSLPGSPPAGGSWAKGQGKMIHPGPPEERVIWRKRFQAQF